MITISNHGIASAGTLEILESLKYISSSDELNQTSPLIPEENWVPSNYADLCMRDKNPAFIRGWVDIVGFRKMVKIENQFYVNGSPKEHAIVQYETVPCTLGVRGFDLPMETKLDVYQEGSNVVAKVTAKQSVLSIDFTGYISFYNITEVFYDYEPAPIVLDYSSQNIEVTVRERNFTIINTTDISIEINKTYYDRYIVRTKHGYFEKINRVWRIETTPKGVNYANETKIDTFRSHNLSHTQNIIPLPDLNFNVTAYGFYSSTNKTNTTTIVHKSDPLAQFTDFNLLGFLSTLSAFSLFIYYRIKHL